MDDSGCYVTTGDAGPPGQTRERVHVSDSLELRDTRSYGLGVFAARDIEAGEVLYYHEGPPTRPFYTRQEILDHPESSYLRTYSYVVGPDAYFTGERAVIEQDIANYMNHSCDPTAWFSGDNCMTARRAIRRGEEITCDYGTFETEISFHRGMTCQCGTLDCRRVLTGLEYRSLAFRKKYAGHMSAYIERLVRGPSWYDPRLYVRSKDADSFGLFTLEPIQAGDTIACYSGRIVTYEQLLEYPEAMQMYNLQIGENLFQMPLFGDERETTDFINHSCEPNCGLSDSVTVMALRDLDSEEEVTIDYATFNSGVVLGSSDNFACNCGTPGCRGQVRSDDWRRPRVRLRLGRYFSPFLRRMIDAGETAGGRDAGGDHLPAAQETPAP